MTKEDKWPGFFPLGVPPQSATPAIGNGFRLVKSIPPSDSDFISTFEEFPGREFKDDDAKIFGTSFHRRLECSKRTRERYRALRHRHIVVGELKNEHGVHLSTPTACGPSHFTVWRWKQSIIHPDFTLDAEAK